MLSIMVLMSKWFGPDLTCHPIDCGAPEEILNGKRNGDCTTYRCQVRFNKILTE